MLGCYDFCGHYEWTFAWLERIGGRTMLREYWDEAINQDSQAEVGKLIAREGFAGMEKYWDFTLLEESPSRGFSLTSKTDVFRIDIDDCPSKGFLLRNGLASYSDYCDHCIGWIGPMMKSAGFVIDHEHNHCGQCWWEMRRPNPTRTPAEVSEVSGERDVRLARNWSPPGTIIDRYFAANGPESKATS